METMAAHLQNPSTFPSCCRDLLWLLCWQTKDCSQQGLENVAAKANNSDGRASNFHGHICLSAFAQSLYFMQGKIPRWIVMRWVSS